MTQHQVDAEFRAMVATTLADLASLPEPRARKQKREPLYVFAARMRAAGLTPHIRT